MSEIGYYDTDLNESIEKVKDCIGKLNKSKPAAKASIIAEAERELLEIRDLEKGFTLSLRQLTSSIDSAHYRKRLSEYKKQIHEVSNDIQWNKSNATRIENGENVHMNNDQTLQAALVIQDKTKDSLRSTQQMIENSKQIASATTQKLEEHSVQIGNITDQVMNMDDLLTRSDKLIRTFSKRMATDRFIVCITFLVFVGIIAIIAYSMINPDQNKFDVPDAVKPPSPNNFT